MKRSAKMFAVLSVLSLVLAACGGNEADPGQDDEPTAAACTPNRLTGYALGKPTTPGEGARFTTSGAVRPLAAQAKPTVKIGMFGDLTGGNSSLVVHIPPSVELAIEQRNAAGDLKVNVEFVPKDNKDGSEETAPAIEQSFIDDEEVVAVIGGAFSGETLAVGELFDAAGLTHVSASATNPDITTKGWPFFRALNTDQVQADKAAVLLKNMGCTKIAVVNDKSDYGGGLGKLLVSAAKANGLEVVVDEGIEPTTDYSALVSTLQAEKPEALYYGGYVKDFSLIVRQIREAGLKDMLLASGDGSKEQPLIDQAGAENAEGVVLTCPCLDPNVAPPGKAKDFGDAYREKYKKDVGIYGAEAYDVANIILDAIAASDDDLKVTREEIFKFIDDLENYEGITKTITFDEKGEVAGGIIQTYVVKDGKINLLGPVDEVSKAS